MGGKCPQDGAGQGEKYSSGIYRGETLNQSAGPPRVPNGISVPEVTATALPAEGQHRRAGACGGGLRVLCGTQAAGPPAPRPLRTGTRRAPRSPSASSAENTGFQVVLDKLEYHFLVEKGN